MERRPTTDQQIGALIHRIAHLYLEVERGMRPPQHLERLLTPTEYSRHRQSPAQDRLPSTGPVLRSDIGRIRFDRDRRGDVTAAVTTREDGDRWGSLVMHMMKTRNGWTVDYIQRIPRRGLTHDKQFSEPEPTDLDERIRRIESELRLVQSAHAATKRRLQDCVDRPDADPRVVGELREQLDQWARILHGVDHDLDSLRRRQELAGQLPSRDAEDGVESAIEQTVDTKLRQILGPKPDEERRRQTWEATRQEIIEYRRRWGVTNTGTILGPHPTRSDQQHERDRVGRSLLEAARTLRRDTPRAVQTKRKAEIHPGREGISL